MMRPLKITPKTHVPLRRPLPPSRLARVTAEVVANRAVELLERQEADDAIMFRAESVLLSG